MLKICTLVFCFSFGLVQAQNSAFHFFEVEQDSIKKNFFLKQLGNGYFPTKYFDFDLRYLVKYNQYEGLRTGLGGVTNKTYRKNLRLTAIRFTALGMMPTNTVLEEAYGYRKVPIHG